MRGKQNAYLPPIELMCGWQQFNLGRLCKHVNAPPEISAKNKYQTSLRLAILF